MKYSKKTQITAILCMIITVTICSDATPAASNRRHYDTAKLAYSGKGPWVMDYDKAVATAKKQKKDLLILFTGSDWCSGCKLLERQILSHAEFIENVSDDFVMIFADLPHSPKLKAEISETFSAKIQELSKQYDIHAIPRIILTTPDGDLYLRTSILPKSAQDYAKEIHKAKIVHPYIQRNLRKIKNPKTPNIVKAKLMDQILSSSKQSELIDEIINGALSINTFDIVKAYTKLKEVNASYPEFADDIIRLDKDNKAGLKEKYIFRNAIRKTYTTGNLQFLDNALSSFRFTGDRLMILLKTKAMFLFLRHSDEADAAIQTAMQAAKGSNSTAAKLIRKLNSEAAVSGKNPEESIKLKLKNDKYKGIERAKLIDQLLSSFRSKEYGKLHPWEDEKEYIYEIIKLDKDNKAGFLAKYEPEIIIHEIPELQCSGMMQKASKLSDRLLKLYPPKDATALHDLLVSNARLMMELPNPNKKLISSRIKRAIRIKPNSPDNDMLKKYLAILRKPTPINWLQGRLGPELIKADGTHIESSTLQNNKLIGLYFSAKYCRYCKKFTPKLIRFRNQLRNAGIPFEVVFVSRDKNEMEMEAYLKNSRMPWGAIPFTPEIIISDLGHLHKIDRLPILVILDAKGKVVSTGGGLNINNADKIKVFNRWMKISEQDCGIWGRSRNILKSR